VIGDVAPQLAALLGRHARVAVRVALLLPHVARGYLLRRRRAPGPGGAAAALGVLRRRRKRNHGGEQDTNQGDKNSHDPSRGMSRQLY
jgi:hypothetical protein